MSKWVAFNVIEVQRTGPQSANLIKLPDVPIRADAVALVVPTVIPSDIAGPDGTPVQTPGSLLSFMGAGLTGPSIMVDNTKEEVLWKLENGPFIEIKEPSKPYPNDSGGKQTKKPALKLIHPNSDE